MAGNPSTEEDPSYRNLLLADADGAWDWAPLHWQSGTMGSNVQPQNHADFLDHTFDPIVPSPARVEGS